MTVRLTDQLLQSHSSWGWLTDWLTALQKAVATPPRKCQELLAKSDNDSLARYRARGRAKGEGEQEGKLRFSREIFRDIFTTLSRLLALVKGKTRRLSTNSSRTDTFAFFAISCGENVIKATERVAARARFRPRCEGNNNRENSSCCFNSPYKGASFLVFLAYCMPNLILFRINASYVVLLVNEWQVDWCKKELLLGELF